MKSYRSDQGPPAEETHPLENELIRSKSTMYTMLSFFIGMQSIVSVMVAVLLAFLIIAIIVFVFFWATMNQELLEIILNYYLVKFMDFIEPIFGGAM